MSLRMIAKTRQRGAAYHIMDQRRNVQYIAFLIAMSNMEFVKASSVNIIARIYFSGKHVSVNILGDGRLTCHTFILESI